MTSFSWSWEQERLTFLPERALWREKGRILMIADLHLGKAEAFQAQGVPFPTDADTGTLNPLLDLCERWQPSRLIILGDLIHSRLGLTERLRDLLRELPMLCGCEIQLIGGNHDRGSWLDGLPQHPSRALGELWLSHEPEQAPMPGKINVCGHLHPVTRVQSRVDCLRLPCFAFDSEAPRLVVPAFGQLTGGHDCGERYRQWLVAEGSIVPWFVPLLKNRGRRSA